MITIKAKISFSIAVLLLLLSACASEATLSIDSFISDYNQNTQNTICKEDFISYVANDEISHCVYIDDLLLTVTSERETMTIKSISLSCSNNPTADIKSLAENIIVCTARCDASKAEEITNALNIDTYCENESFYKSYVFEKDLTFGFVSTDVGNRFYVNYNEIAPVVPTEIPEFQENYTLSKTQE